MQHLERDVGRCCNISSRPFRGGFGKEQDSYKAGFLTFCHHYFVAHPGANAQAVRKRWKPEDGEEFPAQQIGDWFNGMRNNIRRRLKVLIALT